MRVPKAFLVVFTLCLTACGSSKPPPAPAAKPSPVVAPAVIAMAPSPPLPPAPPSAFAGEALSRLLSCADPDFLGQASAQQSAALQTEPRLHCQASTGANTVSCTSAEPVSVFGLALLGFTLSHGNGGHALSAHLQGDMPTLLQGFAKFYPNPARSALYGKLVSLSADDSLAWRARESGEPDQVDFECRVAAPNELLFVTLNDPMTASAPISSSPETPETAPPPKIISSPLAAGTSAIAGYIEFPGDIAPALHVCAISVDNGGAACIRTQREQTRYRIENLPLGDFQIWAWLSVPDGDLRVMRAARQVQCIRAPCPPQTRTIALPDATKIDGVTINDAATGYPDQPPEPN